jgi:hypothetical protein
MLADDHELLLGAFEKLLAGQCEIVGKAPTVERSSLPPTC